MLSTGTSKIATSELQSSCKKKQIREGTPKIMFWKMNFQYRIWPFLVSILDLSVCRQMDMRPFFGRQTVFRVHQHRILIHWHTKSGLIAFPDGYRLVAMEFLLWPNGTTVSINDVIHRASGLCSEMPSTDFGGYSWSSLNVVGCIQFPNTNDCFFGDPFIVIVSSTLVYHVSTITCT